MGEEALEKFAFAFEPGGGRIHLKSCEDNLSAYGGLVAWDHFLERTGILARLTEFYPLARTSPNATPVIDILRAFALNCLVGGQRFAHVRRLQDDLAIAQIIGCQKEAALRRGRIPEALRGPDTITSPAVDGAWRGDDLSRHSR